MNGVWRAFSLPAIVLRLLAQSFVYRPMCDGRYATRSWLISSSLHGATGQYQRFSFSFNLPTRFSDAVTDYCIWQSATIGLSPLRRLTVTITQTQQITLNSNVSPRLELQSLWSYDLMALYKYVYCYYFFTPGSKDPRGQKQKSTELKRCSVTEMRWNKYEVSFTSPVWEHKFACGGRMMARIDRLTERRTDARQFHRPCSVDKKMSEVSGFQ